MNQTMLIHELTTLFYFEQNGSLSECDLSNQTNNIYLTGNMSTVCKQVTNDVCGRLEAYGLLVPDSLVLVSFGTVMSLLVVFLNSILISILLRKNNKSPINVMLSSLGFCDALCTICLFPPLLLEYLLDFIPGSKSYISFDNIPGMVYYEFSYPHCIIFDWMNITLSDCFHTMSIWLTTSLGFMKALVLLFPLQSRIYFNRKVAKCVCVVVMVFCLAIYTPLSVTKVFEEGKDGLCCIDRRYGSYYFEKFRWIIALTYLIAFVVLIVSTTYICVTLTVQKTTIRRSTHSKVAERKRRAAIIVTLIVIIFMLSEAISATCYISSTFTNSFDFCLYSFYQYQQLVLLFGFASNFFIYWFMSKNLRSRVKTCIGTCMEPQKSNNTTTTRFSDQTSTSEQQSQLSRHTRF